MRGTGLDCATLMEYENGENIGKWQNQWKKKKVTERNAGKYYKVFVRHSV
jgi:hypothetical protein